MKDREESISTVLRSRAGKSTLVEWWFHIRNFRSSEVFALIKKYGRGDVLDVGGWDFILTAQRKKIKYKTWTTLEISDEKRLEIADPAFRFVVGDGCRMQFENDSFDTVVNIQVLEHVFEPIKMVEEIARVLKPGGHGIFLIPQTSTVHFAPEHYYNFTRYWIQKAMQRAGLNIVELKALGGVWTSMASHLLFFFLQSFRFEGMSSPESKRNFFFYLLYPLMVVYALAGIPFCMFLSLGDLSEEPNNYAVVVRK